ncbi:uncharacterized protein HMPREF1541_04209 [Cyphellophora europaea CBS 101466]|uniref:IBR domain-containing protein n=1 Tax=Cyphellophora europaea (strain CBS 101466) TaxID=1220924 RepID=W2S2I3_CYPE1|nr:uncharacterized protein HMPREF1541_04209 [Cyphellophora europaea CBS 101466]ETN42268.1 hypothetical protein HMPREF1541_04209 [Cyphellophora europaea CBS 101466]
MAGPSRRYNSDDEVDPYVGIDTESALHTLDSRIAELLGFRATIAENRDSDSDADRRMAESMTAAVLSDGPLITTHIREEEVAAHDHRLARRLDDEFKRTRRMTPPTDGDLPPLSSLPCESEMAFLSKIAGLFVSESAARSLLPNNILVAETEANGQLKASHQCTICLDSKTWVEVFQAPCRHEYCGDCIRTLFQESYKDESLFPPRCCKQTIPITGKFLALFLPTSIRNRYATRSIEVTTTDRTYCNKCNTFILPRTTEDNVAVCSACKARTCSKCKRAAHTGDCTTDPAEHKVLRLAKEQGWQRCAVAVTNSAISVLRSGSLVDALPSLWNDYSNEQIRLSIERLSEPRMQLLAEHRFSKLLAILRAAMRARTPTELGGELTAQTTAKNAIRP